ncbi:MAG: hypothetical protein WCK46_00445 [Candidatus Adlerbacteria bacterium]
MTNKNIFAIILASAMMFLAGVASAQTTYQYGCMADGTKVQGTGTNPCYCTQPVEIGGRCPVVRKTPNYHGGGVVTPRQSPGQRSEAPAHTAPGSTFTAGQLNELVEQGVRDREINRRGAPQGAPHVGAPVQVAQAPAPQAAGVIRAFTPVDMARLAGALKGIEKGILNAPADEMLAKMSQLTGMNVTAEKVLAGKIIPCQKVGVEGKRPIGVRSELTMSNVREFTFVAMGDEFKDCPSGMTLYAVPHDTGTYYVIIADGQGRLIGRASAEVRLTP